MLAFTSSFPHRPDIKFFCDLDYDPFLIMQDQNKVYGIHLPFFWILAVKL